jgi:hypothetical protein
MVVLAIGLLPVGACTSGGGQPAVSEQVVPTPNASESEELALQAKRAAATQEARQDKLAREVAAMHTLPERLAKIVTVSCLDSSAAKYDRYFLAELYRKYWQANNRWSFPLDAAQQQAGGCPTPPPRVSAG